MIDIVETPLYPRERNLFSFVLVSFAKLKQIQTEELLYSVYKNEKSFTLYIEHNEDLIQFKHNYDNYEYQLSLYPSKGHSFHRLTDENLETLFKDLLQSIEAKNNNFIFYA
jgi:hypothetical protein